MIAIEFLKTLNPVVNICTFRLFVIYRQINVKDLVL